MSLIQCLILTSILLLFSCAPATETGESAANANVLVRPNVSGSILYRALPFKEDSRISYCEVLNEDMSTYSGMRDMQLEPLASLSKLITSVWALEKLGPDFRFKMDWYLNPVSNDGLYDAYLNTNYDPVVNIEKLLFSISELNKIGVKKIRNLVIDQSTRVYLSVLSEPHLELDQVPIDMPQVVENLMLILNSSNWLKKTSLAKQKLAVWAKENSIDYKEPTQFSVENVTYVKSDQINIKNYKMKKTILSAPLFRYLKNINVYSNNYMADSLFSYLGGVSEFRKFQKQILNLSNDELKFYTGSGLAYINSGNRLDNLGSCFSFIKILSLLKKQSEKFNLNLGHLLLNPSLDRDGTYDVQADSQNYSSALVLKTGRLFEVPALNIAGFVSTTQGTLSFAFLAHDFENETQASQMENSRIQMLHQIFDFYPTTSIYNTLNNFEILL